MNLIIEKKKISKDDIAEEEKDERYEFEDPKKIVETTEWKGTYLSASEMARAYFKLLNSIGRSKIERILERTRRKQ
jgi:hypothetical protein